MGSVAGDTRLIIGCHPEGCRGYRVLGPISRGSILQEKRKEITKKKHINL